MPQDVKPASWPTPARLKGFRDLPNTGEQFRVEAGRLLVDGKEMLDEGQGVQ